MTTRPDELEAFKSSVNLTEFAVARGYELDRKASSRSSVVMVHPDGDKVVIAKARSDGHWIYFSVGDPSDSGTIIDFVQKRDGGSLGEVRKLLRPWIGEASSPPPPRPARSAFAQDLQPIERDLLGVRAAYEAMRPLSAGFHPYLAGARRIPPALLADERFASRIRADARGNAVFPHFNRDGLCGFELKNAGFTGFAKGGAKGLWTSLVRPDDRALVLAEGAIDALSYAALHGHAGVRFVSLAGQVSPEQVNLAAAAIEKLPSGSVVLAFDNDEAGDRLTARFEGLFVEVGRSGLELRVHRPGARGADWNDVLRARAAEHSPPPPELGR
ncbi:MAG TPA: DUF3991 and TOPRIM domain-containing protein [Candidatus Krumholzibacteria bacterium]